MTRPQDRAAHREHNRRSNSSDAFDREACLTIIFDHLATSAMGLHKILSLDTVNLPSVPVFWRWLRADDALPEDERQGYSRRYAMAKRLQAEYLESELLVIADEPPPSNSFGNVDNGAVQHSKLRIDTRKWVMARLHSTKYGDRTTLAGDPDAPLHSEQKEDLSRLSDDELAELIRLKKKIEGS